MREYPDLVRLKSGGMLRGTIVEIVAGESVTIQTPTGELRKVPLSETTYAGAASKDPERIEAAAPSVKSTSKDDADSHPYATIHAAQAHLDLVAAEPGVTFHLQRVSAGGIYGFEKLCTAPCAVDLPAGVHRLALSRPNNAPVVGTDDITVSGNQTVKGEFVGHGGGRVVGVVLAVLGAGALAGSAVLMGSAATDTSGGSSGPLLGGLAGIFVGTGLLTGGVFLIFQGDTPAFEVSPAANTASRGAPLYTRLAAREGASPGTGLTARFHF